MRVLPLLMALWLRYVLQTMATIGYGLATAGASIFQTRHWRFQCTRAVLFCMSNAFAMLSLRYLPLAEFTAIAAMTPLAKDTGRRAMAAPACQPVALGSCDPGLCSTLDHRTPWQRSFHCASTVVALATDADQHGLSDREQRNGRQGATVNNPDLHQSGGPGADQRLPALGLETVANDGLMLGALGYGLGSAIGHLCVLKAYEYAHPATITPFFLQPGFVPQPDG